MGSNGDKSIHMNSFIVTAVGEYSESLIQRKAELVNQATKIKHYIIFKEHDANSRQISAIFTDEEYSLILSAAILETSNGHTYKTIQVDDILTVVL